MSNTQEQKKQVTINDYLFGLRNDMDLIYNGVRTTIGNLVATVEKLVEENNRLRTENETLKAKKGK